MSTPRAVTCPQCGVSFAKRSNVQKYCRRECKMAAIYAARRANPLLRYGRLGR